ncbi:type II secretion system F family protein [Aquaspirillum serpens]|uniref:type II secretion system F family protein n=1 Tax=Aquaspirillum serpens TaxID=190 RepID=UPI0003B345E3|nr:type II secretion system F family protein [Aquaspirillum serpens]
MRYYYRSIDHNHKIHTGYIDVESITELEKSLKARNLFLIDCKLLDNKKKNWLSFGKKIEIDQQLQLLFEWLLLLQSGITVISSIESLIEASENTNRKNALQATLLALEQGKSLYQAISHNQIFSNMVKEFIRIGETSGSLITSMNHAYTYLQEQKNNQDTIRQAMLYPMFTVVIGLAAVVFLSYWILPELTSFLLSLDQELPTTTRILISLSDWLQTEVDQLAIILGFIFLIIYLLIKHELISREKVDYFCWRLPIFGEIQQMIFLSQFSRLLSITLTSGLTLADSIQTSNFISNNAFIQKQIELIYQKLEQGFCFHESLAHTQLAPQIIVSLIYNAEKTGKIAPCLDYISIFYREKANQRLQKVQKLIEPCLTLFIGLILAFFIMATLGPLYELSSQLGQ